MKKGYNVEDLFIHYLFRLSRDYPYIKLISNDTSTTVSLGYEKCIDQLNDISYQDFIVFGNYLVTMDLQKLETFFKNLPTTLTVLSNNEILLESKSPVEHCWDIKDDLPAIPASEKLLEHLETHKRTVLCLPKVRFLEYELSPDTTVRTDPIYLGERSLAKAYLILFCSPYYIGFENINSEFTVGGSKFVTSLYEIQHLDSSKYAVFVLSEGRNSIIFEIINKVL